MKIHPSHRWRKLQIKYSLRLLRTKQQLQTANYQLDKMRMAARCFRFLFLVMFSEGTLGKTPSGLCHCETCGHRGERYFYYIDNNDNRFWVVDKEKEVSVRVNAAIIVHYSFCFLLFGSFLQSSTSVCECHMGWECNDFCKQHCRWHPSSWHFHRSSWSCLFSQREQWQNSRLRKWTDHCMARNVASHLGQLHDSFCSFERWCLLQKCEWNRSYRQMVSQYKQHWICSEIQRWLPWFVSRHQQHSLLFHAIRAPCGEDLTEQH